MLSFAKEEIMFWKKCLKNEDCVIDYQKACGAFCYNRNFEKDAFEWEKKIVWDCMAQVRERVARCESNQCICQEITINYQGKSVRKALQK